MEKRLTERERDILLKLVELYIKSGEPVGSRTLQKTYGIPFSSATIRNVMADLEDKGFLYQPHTSAGRVPTDEGLKVYINHLFLSIGEGGETKAGRIIESLKAENIKDMEKIFPRVLDFLQNTTGYVGFGAKLIENLTVKSVTLIRVATNRVLMVLEFHPDYVLHRVIDVSIPESELPKLSKELSKRFHGKTLREIRKELVEDIESLKKEIADISFKLNSQILATLNEVNSLEFHGTSNIVNVLSRDVDRLREVLKLLEEKSLFLDVLKKFMEEKRQVDVILGSETDIEPLYPFSFVVGKFQAGYRNGGIVGILGPKRMNYSQIIPVVENVARALSLILRD
ncbi:MAG: heat-inducible transcriptional repressor HrcA [Desulfurobacteriaceae bacterium]